MSIESVAAIEPKAWFATPIWTIDITEEKTISKTIKSALSALPESAYSAPRSNRGGRQTNTDLQNRLGFENIRDVIAHSAVACAKSLHFDLARYDLTIKEMWVNTTPAGAFHHFHVHPHSFLSGTYYIEVPEGSGNLLFQDPITARMSAAPPTTKNTPYTQYNVPIKPYAGLMVLFPSWLCHAVEANTGSGTRQSLSFNINYTEKKRG